MTATPMTAHLSDPELIRHVDGEGDAAEVARRAAHVGTCPACAARVRLLDEQSGTVRAWLLRTDPPHRPAAPPRRRPAVVAAAPWLRAAAIILLLAAPLAAFPPVRHWVAERVGLAEETAPAADAVSQTAQPADAVIRFTPARGTFTVRVDAPASGATLTVGRAAGPEAVLRGGRAGGPAPIISDEALQLPASGAGPRRYDLRVPNTVDAVLVLIDGRATRLAAAALDAGSTVPLTVNR